MTATIIAGAALAISLIGPLAVAAYTTRAAKNARLQDLRHELYVAALEYSEFLRRAVDYNTDAWHTGPEPGRVDNSSSMLNLTARMRLLAPDGLPEAWTALVHADDVFWWTLREHPDQHTISGTSLHPTNEVAEGLRKAAEAFTEAARRVVAR
jgi:hypothetical protein